VEKIIYVDVI